MVEKPVRKALDILYEGGTDSRLIDPLALVADLEGVVRRLYPESLRRRPPTSRDEQLKELSSLIKEFPIL